MAPKQKTQQRKRSSAPQTPSADEIAHHFMALWQEQWHEFIKNPPPPMPHAAPASPFGGMNPFGFPLQFGQTPNHGASSFSDQTAHMATAALAASQQCLELLEQFGQRLDELAAQCQSAAPKSTKRKPITRQSAKQNTKPKAKTTTKRPRAR